MPNDLEMSGLPSTIGICERKPEIIDVRCANMFSNGGQENPASEDHPLYDSAVGLILTRKQRSTTVRLRATRQQQGSIGQEYLILVESSA